MSASCVFFLIYEIKIEHQVKIVESNLMIYKVKVIKLINKFKWHVNLWRVISMPSSYLHFFFNRVSYGTIIFKQIYWTHKWDPNRYYHSKAEWTWE